jgi:hypothetical protein
MCGIHFVINSNTYTTGLDKFLADAFLANQVRGTDSAGLFQVKNTFGKAGVRNVEYYKAAISGTDLLDEKIPKDMLLAANREYATVGHVRAATTGVISDENAHPFLTIRADGSRIIGVHNGTLPGWRALKDAEKFNVDSAWLFSKLANDGIEAFEGFEGAFCLVWYDSNKPDSLFVARNDKRPLFWAYSPTGGVMLAASELGMLGWLMQRNNIQPRKVNGYEFAHPEAGHVYEINLKRPTEFEKTKFSAYDSKARIYHKPDAKPATSTPFAGALDKPKEKLPVVGQPSYSPAATTAFEDFRQGEQNKFFREIKQALAQHRGGGAKDDGAEPPAANANDKVTSNNGAIAEKDFLYMHEPNTRNVSSTEEERAKKIGIFGLCVNFCGYFYDEESAIIYGDFRTIEGGKPTSYDAIVRGETQVTAEAKYIHPTTLKRMVVVGVYQDPKKKENPYVILDDPDKAKEKKYYTTSVMQAALTKAAGTVH